jgi:hypothetical protein
LEENLLNTKRLIKLLFHTIPGFSLILASTILPISGLAKSSQPVAANSTSIVRRVNAPYLGASPETVTSFTPAIFWFGKVTPTDNYADTRVYYYDGYLKVVLHIIDRLLWEDNARKASDISRWDAISLYLNLDGNTGGSPSPDSYRLDLELNNLQATYRGNSSDWISTSVPISTTTAWRGDLGPNSNQDDKGWIAYFQIPFSSLGLSTKPATGTVWGFSVDVHDRDDANGSTFQDTVWPEAMNPAVPATWGQIHFGVYDNALSPALAARVFTVQDGFNGGVVKDADVGGHTECGGNQASWTQWGVINYAGLSQINIQNQWDVADWPCFSKYYITFSLDNVPKGLTIVSATVTMYLTGNAGGGEYGTPPDSYIQAFSVGDDWNEATINWNNAPLAVENLSGTWVYPKTTANWPAYSWNVSKAVLEAYQTGSPLRLAFYSADGDYHTGKYFSSSDWSEVQGRPFLTIGLGNPCDSPGVQCTLNYLPLITKK